MDAATNRILRSRLFEKLREFACGPRPRPGQDRMSPQDLEAAGSTLDLEDLTQTGFINMSFSPTGYSPSKVENLESLPKIDDSRGQNDVRDSSTFSRQYSHRSNSSTSIHTPEESSNKTPLTAAEPNIIVYRDEMGELTSAVSLTEAMIRQWNGIFRCENKIHRWSTRLDMLVIDKAGLERKFLELNESLSPPFSAPSRQIIPEELQEDIHHQLDQVWKDREKLQSKKDGLEGKLRYVQAELRMLKGRLYQTWEELLKENNLIDKLDDNGSLNSEVLSSIHDQDSVSIEVMLPTASEVARNAVDKEIEVALDDMYAKERLLHEAQDKINNWQLYYDDEYQAYCRCVEEGKMEAARTEFDLILLNEAREAQKELGIGEKEYGDARQHVKSLGVLLDDTDQESDFADYQDDGYRESMEADIIGRVDRAFIEKWMNEEEDRPEHSTECDDWEAKTIDLCDSISVVAEGKERKRIDRWRSRCEILADDIAE